MIGKGYKVKSFAEYFKMEVAHEGNDFENAVLTITDYNRPGLQFHNFYDYFEPRRLQIIGKAEDMYLKSLSSQQRKKCFDGLFQYDIPALALTSGLEPLPECLESAEEYGRTVLRSMESTVTFTSHAIEHLSRMLAPCITRHGVLLDIHGEGVMITAESGVGKSEVAMELLMRGHHLVADDAVELRHISGQIFGQAPEIIRHYIELRGIGVIDVRQLFGMRAVKDESQVDLVVHLESWDDNKTYDRLGIDEHYTDILGVKIPIVTIPVKPGRNLATIVEVAAMNNRNRRYGFNAAAELERRVNLMAEGKSY